MLRSSIHIHAQRLKEELCRILSFSYALIGCDTVSQFQGRVQNLAWKAWKSKLDIIETLFRLSSNGEITK